MSLSIEQQIANKICGHGKGWAFAQKDFVAIGSRSAVDLALHRLEKKGKIRRVLRGLYDFPRYSKDLDSEMSPDISQVARALARKFNWDIQPSGPTALNIIGLSTQVLGRYVFQSNGPGRTYQVGSTALEFKNTVLKETGFRHWQSELLVRGLKSLGESRIDAEVISKIKDWLDQGMCSKVLKDTTTVTGWVYAAICKVCSEDA